MSGSADINLGQLFKRNGFVSSAFSKNRACRTERTIYKVCKNYIRTIYSYYTFPIFLIYCKKLKEAFKSKINEPLALKSKSTLSASFSLERVLDIFSYWFPKALNYGLRADAIYDIEERTALILIPMPIVKDGNYVLWLFTFTQVERITPKLRDLLLIDIHNNSFSPALQLVERKTHFIVADIIRGKMTPKFGRRSIYVIKSDYAWKVYEIAAKSIEGFVTSFRKNVKYGDDLLELCDEMERFASILREEAEKLKLEIRPASRTHSPTHHPAREGGGKKRKLKQRKRQEERREIT